MKVVLSWLGLEKRNYILAKIFQLVFVQLCSLYQGSRPGPIKIPVMLAAASRAGPGKN